MLFVPKQIQELLELIEYHHVLFGAEFLGVEPLEPEDIDLLHKYGIEAANLDEKSYIEMSYKFGVISKAIGNPATKKMQFNDFKKWLRSGGYIPLSPQEKLTVSYLKRKSFSFLKKLGLKISGDVQQMMLNEDLKRRNRLEKLIKKELSEGTLKRKSFSDIMLNLGHKTDDWQRDWGRIVETELNSAYQEGRSDEIQKNNPGKDPLVFKHVRNTACRHCIAAYLTNGLGSKPRIFKLSQLRENGSNIGRKAKEWKPVIESHHPWCFCELDEVPDGYEWDEKEQMFNPPQNYVRKVQRRSKVKITIGDKEYEV
jgi:hypothetical protein